MASIYFLLAASLSLASAYPKDAKNVLLLVAHDFRPDLGSYGIKEARTPNLDGLAEAGILFSSAHVQYSYCAPSRNSFMSGRRPDATKVYNFINNFRQVGNDWDPLPAHFKNNGYLVTGGGTMYHNTPDSPSPDDWPRSWSTRSPDGKAWPYGPKGSEGVTANQTSTKPKCDRSGLPKAEGIDKIVCLTSEASGLEDVEMTSGVLGRLSIAADNYKKTGQPFFVGFGYQKPHYPWQYPKKFFDNIPEDVPEAKHKAWIADVPHIHFHQCGEVDHPYWDTNGMGTALSKKSFAGYQSLMRRAYHGCISYVDDQMGRAIEMIDQKGLTNDTVVVFMADHGMQTGEHDLWCKMTTLETGTRVPLIIRAPWMNAAVNVKTSTVVEAVDLYPTLSELAGLPLPAGKAGEYLGGESLVPIMRDPLHGTTVKNMALSQMARCWQNNTHYHDTHGHHGMPGAESNHTNSWESMSDCHWVERNYIDFMGYRMRTSNMSITRWVRWDGKHLRPDWNHVVGTELYSHEGNTGLGPEVYDDFENENLAEKPEYASIQAKLLTRLQAEVDKQITPSSSAVAFV